VDLVKRVTPQPTESGLESEAASVGNVTVLKRIGD
jgi:hypothetical protein